MRSIDQTSIILGSKSTVLPTYNFTIMYADMSGTLCKICIGHEVMVKGIYNKEYITIQGILKEYNSSTGILAIKVNDIIYKLEYKNLIYIYNVTINRYNFDIIDNSVRLPEITIPDNNDTTTNPILYTVKLSNLGSGYNISTKLSDYEYGIRSIKQGEGIKVISNNNEITISSDIQLMTNDDAMNLIKNLFDE